MRERWLSSRLRQTSTANLLGAAVMFHVFVAAFSAGTEYLPPLRPTTAKDNIAYAVGGSDTVVLAEFENARHIRVRQQSEDLLPTISETDWQFKVLTCLKGTARAQSHITVGHNRFAPPARSLTNPTLGARYLLFLSVVDHKAVLARGARFVPFGDWDFVLRSSPYDFANGAALVSNPDGPGVISGVKDAIRAQEPSALAATANLIAYGRVDFDNPQLCAPFGRPAGCISFVIQDPLYGGVAGETLSVYSVMPFYKSCSHGAIVFLARGQHDTYEIVGGPGGLVPIGVGGMDASHRTIGDWRGIAHNVHRGQDGGGAR